MECLRLEKATYTQGVAVLDQVTTIFETGRSYLIYSDSSVELSLLTTILTGREGVQAGKLFYFGQETSRIRSASRLAEDTGVIFQKYNYLPELSAVENLHTYLQFIGKKKKRRDCLDYLSEFGFDTVSGKRPLRQTDLLTQKKYCLAKAVCTQPPLLVLDHLLTGLVIDEQEQMIRYLTKKTKDAQTCLLLMETERFLGRYTDEVWGLNQGKLSFIKSR